jgi:hypothetical protein
MIAAVFLASVSSRLERRQIDIDHLKASDKLSFCGFFAGRCHALSIR